jgi:DNA-binding NarL/FixJ family response regulator
VYCETRAFACSKRYIATVRSVTLLHMPITVLLADGSDFMRAAIVLLLSKDPRIEFVGAAASFDEALQLTAALKPDVLLLDPHMHDTEKRAPKLAKAQLRQSAGCIVAISVWTDENAKALAHQFGAHVLLDKTKLDAELIPAIIQFCPQGSVGDFKQPAPAKQETGLPVSTIIGTRGHEHAKK